MPIHGYPGGVISATQPTVDNTTASGVWTTEKQLQYQAQGLWPPAVAQPISRSLRFNSADSTHLTRTPASASNQKTWTWSGWCKRSTLSTLQSIFSSRSGSTGCNLQWGEYSTTNDYIIFYSDTANVFVTTPVYRDASAWYHIVLALDTTQATASNRVKLYINGTQVTAFASTSYPSQNADLRINSANQHCIGSTTPSAEFLNGYLTEINFIDGQQLTPSSFGQTNSNTGVWEPKAFSGTYGTNGFYLNFSDNSGTTSTTLGKDYSGNGNNWTPNNFSVTAGAGNDSLVDTPTPYGTDTGAGGEVRGNYCTWNPLYGRDTLTNGNLDITVSAVGTAHPATMFVSSGKWYWEILLVDSNYARVGICNTDGANQSLGDTANGWCYLNDGRVYNNGVATSYGVSATNNDIINVALDLDAGKIWYGKNGTWMASGNPATGANPSQTFTAGQTMAPAVAYGFNTGSDAFTGNFGQRPFAYTAPSGFKALCTQNLPTPTVVQGDDYFNTVLYTGNGSTQSVTGVGFQPDFVWYKSRSSGSWNHGLFDVLRGTSKQLFSNTTGAEGTYSGVTSFDANGFTVGSDNGGNESGGSMVAWNWKANGAGSSNTAGTITSTVSASTTSGFSVVTYTGTGANATVGHGLGATPAFVIIKDRGATSDWRVWTTSFGTGRGLSLNSTTGTSSNSEIMQATPTSTLMYLLGTGYGVNNSGNTYVAYCFAAIPGYSAFGSYTGNGSADGPFVYTGFRPAFVLIKNTTSGTADWVIYDTVRNTYNTADNRLRPNSSGAELTRGAIDFLSNGMKMRNGSSSGYEEINTSGQNYIYAAFATNPFKYALAR